MKNSRGPLFVLILCSSLPAISAEFVKNGSFEINGGIGQIQPTTPAITTLSDWTKGLIKDPVSSQGFAFVINNNIDSTGTPSHFTPTYGQPVRIHGPGNSNPTDNGFVGSPDGGFFTGFDGDYGRASIEQEITGLTTGETYTLKFQYAGAQMEDATGATTQQWQVDFGTDQVLTPVMNVPSKGFVGWRSFTQNFVATSMTQILKFTPLGESVTPGPGSLPPFLMLDGVSLQPVPGPLPLLGAAAALGWSSKIRQRIKRRNVSKG